MKRASNTFSILQAIAATAGLAILLWSIGLPSIRFAEAASVTFFSDTLSTSEPSVASDHTIEYVSTNGVAAGEAIVITFDAAGDNFDLTGIGVEDIDLLEDGVQEDLATNWTVTTGTSPDTVTITSNGAGGLIAGGATTTILIGTNATNGSPDSQIINPAAGPYKVNVDVAGGTDTGETIVAIVSTVTVTASVDTLFTFTVNGVAGNQLVNTADTTGGTTTPTTIPFGKLDAGVASTAAQNLAVTTNAKNGFVVTVIADGQLESQNGADIDSFIEGADTSTPTAWVAPTPTPGLENEYGHWGLSSSDTTLTAGLSDLYSGGDSFVAASTSPVEVLRHDGPIDGTGAGQGTAEVIYKVEISTLQEAATDYSAILTYVATPVF